jgi:hypothetical protein
MTGRFIKFNAALCVVAAMWFLPASAEEALLLSQQDCDAILSSYAVTPKAVPAELVEACKNAINAAPAAGAAARSAADPCSGPGAGGSVYCWGPWSLLAPAAGPAGPALASTFYEDEPRPEVLGLVPDIEPDLVLPLGGCGPGGACGFATVVADSSGRGDQADRSVERFNMLDDGTSFTVAPGAANEIQSVTDMTAFFPDNQPFWAVGLEPGQLSLLNADVIPPDGAPPIVYDSGYWGNVDWGNVDINTDVINSGGFAWGNASTQAVIDSLNNIGSDKSISFSGLMAVDGTTQANFILNFGVVPNWTGNWVNPNYNFTAGGAMSGADFVSSPEQFSDNVQSGYVQGALLGPLGDQAVTHVVDVTLDNVGIVRDVGLAFQQP